MVKTIKKKHQPLDPATLPAPVMSLAELGADASGAILPASIPAPRPTSPEPPVEQGPGRATARRARRALIELRLRQMEALRLYEPLPKAAEFHESNARIRIAWGSNQSSKTTAALFEVGRAATNQDPFGKWPAKGRFYIVGHTDGQIGRVLYPKLFKPGETFDIIKDEHTGQWRVFKEWLDAHREHEKRPSPPMIPRRFLKGGSIDAATAWKDKKLNVPERVELVNGWELYFFSSEGIPPQGDAIDGWLIDERCKNQGWLPELMARILRKNGKGMWSACPQIGSPQLFDLHKQAGREADDERPIVQQYHFLLRDNPYVQQEVKDDMAATLSAEERRVRIDGEFIESGFRVYPEFSMEVHGYEGDGFQVPYDWSRYIVIDPGHQVCAVLFAAVPPPSKKSNFVLLYDELYIKKSDSEKLAAAVASKSKGIVYERMIIDDRMGRQTESGSGQKVKWQYSAALKRHKVESAIGQNFVRGNDDVDAGVLKFREWMRVREDGTPRLRILRGRLPNFEREIERYSYKVTMRKGEPFVEDKPDTTDNHLMDCGRYLAQFEPRYVRPKKAAALQSPAVRAMQRKKDQARKKQGQSAGVIRLGPESRAA